MVEMVLGQIFSPADLEKAELLFETAKGREFHKAAIEYIVTPSLAEINERTHQQNDPDYLAYLLEHVLAKRANHRGRL